MLGRKGSIALATFQMIFLVLTCIGKQFSCAGCAASPSAQHSTHSCACPLMRANCCGCCCVPLTNAHHAVLISNPACPHCNPTLPAAYSITGAAAMQTIARYFGSAPNKEWQLVLIMGAIELCFSQARRMSGLERGAQQSSGRMARACGGPRDTGENVT